MSSKNDQEVKLNFGSKVPGDSDESLSFIDLNSMLNIPGENGEIQFEKEKEAVRKYFLTHVNPNTVFFHDLEEKLTYLVDEGFYEKEKLEQYSFSFIKSLFKKAYAVKYRFSTLIGAYKFYVQYALKTNDGSRYLERYEDRVCMVALTLARGDESLAEKFMYDIIYGRTQPATPTFLNAGKKQRGEYVSCFLLRTEDNMESITDVVSSSLQLSKRGGGVGILLTNLRESGAPIKNIENQSSGLVPVMKLLEDSFSYANQLGARQGAGAVYISCHHPDIYKALDTKRENADEKIRIKTLSMGIIITDIAFELARRNESMYLFSPYDVERVYGVPMSDISISEKYYEMIEDPRIKKTKINARGFFQTIAELQFESGYPYLMFEDTANRWNNVSNVGRITQSNLCVTGDTELLTDSGYRKAIDLYNSQEDIRVIVDKRARDMNMNTEGLSIESSTKMHLTANNAKVFKVKTSYGKEIKATEWHKMYVARKGKIEKIPLSELVVGDMLLTVDYEKELSGKSGFDSVTSIEFFGKEDVYDVTVPNGNSVIFNGIATGNCSEILQPSTPSSFDENGDYEEIGRDISCNLASLNVSNSMRSADLGDTVKNAMRMLTAVSEMTSIGVAKTVKRGNDESHSVGLGAMNLHGFLGSEKIMYGSEEALDFVNTYFAAVKWNALYASMEIAKEKGENFKGFEQSDYTVNYPVENMNLNKFLTDDSDSFIPMDVMTKESKEILDKNMKEGYKPSKALKYYTCGIWETIPHTERIENMFEQYSQTYFTQQDWIDLDKLIQRYGLYNMNHMAVAPTGSISHIVSGGATASIHQIPAKIETRKEGKVGRVYIPAPGMNEDNIAYFQDAYEMGYKPLIDTYAVAGKHVDQGLSLTLFFNHTDTTRTLNKAYIYAWSRGKEKNEDGVPALYDPRTSWKSGFVKTLYYSRVRSKPLAGTESEFSFSMPGDVKSVEECESCQI